MTRDDKIEFAKAWTAVCDLYDKDISTESVKLVFNSLARFTIAEVKHAIHVHVTSPKSGRFMPKPADLVEILEGSSDTRALKAWTKVEKAVRCVGQYMSVVFDDPVIHAVVSDMGGWVKLCSMTSDELPFRAREFEKRYAAYLINGVTCYPSKLIGISESQNHTRGFDINSVTYIGNRDAAKKIETQGADRALQITREA